MHFIDNILLYRYQESFQLFKILPRTKYRRIWFIWNYKYSSWTVFKFVFTLNICSHEYFNVMFQLFQANNQCMHNSSPVLAWQNLINVLPTLNPQLFTMLTNLPSAWGGCLVVACAMTASGHPSISGVPVLYFSRLQVAQW